MNTKAVLGIVALLVIIGVVWALTKGPSDYEAAPGETGSTSGENSGESTFASLIAQGGSRTCTVSVANEGGTSEGTVYISGGMMRGDFTTTANGQTMAAHMIQADGYMYSWSDAAPQGVKVALSATQNTQAQSQGIDPNANVDYRCSPGVSDQSKFEVPSNVTFMEFSGSAGMMPR